MTKYEFTVTIGASALNLAAQAFAGTAGVSYPAAWKNVYGTTTLLSSKLSVQLAGGATGHAYVGPASVTSAGVNADSQLDPSAVSGNAGGQFSLDTSVNANTVDLSQYWLHGSNSGDKVLVSYYQE